MEDILLKCLDCGEVFCPTNYDKYPSFSYDESDISIQERDDLIDFNLTHKDHTIVELKILEDSYCSVYPFLEPIREDFLKATDGEDIFTIKRWRDNINQPLKYEIIDFEIVYNEPQLDIQSKDIKRQMLYDSDIYKFDEKIIGIIINLYKQFVSQIGLDNILECGFSMDNPMVSYGKLDDNSKEDFLWLCRPEIGEKHTLMLERFIDDNSEYDDVMNIQITSSFGLEPLSDLCHVLN
jgi:hypothetical protein